MRLATLSQPTNRSLYVGWLTLLGVALGPLILMLHGLLGRLFDSLAGLGNNPIKPIHRRLVELLMLVGMVLVVVGGTKSTYTVNAGSPRTEYSKISKAGTAIIVVVMAFLCLECSVVVRDRIHLAKSEHRILFSVIFCIPFVSVRLVYSCILAFSNVHTSPWLLLGMSSAMEVVVALVCEATGFSLGTAAYASRLTQKDHEMGSNTL
jgi:uncharacterized membrane protein